MTHRVLQIRDKVRDLVAAVPSIGGRVRTDRYPWPEDTAGTGCRIRIANWLPIGEEAYAVMGDAFLNLEFTAARNDDDVDDQLLIADAETHAALKLDETLGLPFVILSRRLGFPTDTNAEGELPTGSAVAQWVFQFQYDENSME